MNKHILLFFVLLAVAAIAVQGAFIEIGFQNTTLRNASYPIRFGADAQGMTDCVLLIYSDASNTSGSAPEAGDIRGVPFGNATNNTGADTTFEFEINTNALQDAGDHNITVFCTNSTVGVPPTRGNISISFANASVHVDNTNPSQPTGLTTEIFTNATTGALSLSANTISATNSNTCTLRFIGSSPISGATPSAVSIFNRTQCGFTINNANKGTYEYRIIANDGLNSTESATTSFTVKQKNTGGGAVAQEVRAREAVKAQQVRGSALGLMYVYALGGLVVVIVILGLIFFFSRRR